MVEFNHPYRQPNQSASQADLEKPIFPISQVGQTIPEYDPSGRHKDIIEVAQAAIRGGSGALQIVMMQVPGRTGRGAHLHGREVREALREVVKANKVIGVGVELPTSLSNVSGWQGNQISEEIRKNHLDEAKSAIEFVADVFEGGGTDILSWEFPRRFFDANWNQDKVNGKPVFESHPDEGEGGTLNFVDTRNGQIVPIPVSKGVYRKKDPKTGLPSEELHKWEYTDFLKDAGGDIERAHETYKKEHFQTQADIARSEASRRKHNLEIEMKSLRYDQAKQKAEDKRTDKEQEIVEYVENQQSYIAAQERVEREQQEQIDKLTSFSSYAKEQAQKSYKDLGLYAMEEESHRKKMRSHLYVGPEIGWPTYYGGHPDEFIELIEGARKKMAQELVDHGFQGKKYKADEAAKIASQHIRGTLDTGHIGMWLKHFRPDLPYRERKKKFNDWYLEQVEKLAKADVIGNVQIVDAYGGEHGHLPPGQGIFPIKESMEILKKHGFDGHIVSEGHEEDRIEDGRIRTQAWRLLGSPVAAKYGSPSWSQVDRAYQGRTYSPKQMFGSYTPPFGEYKPWSDIPFE